jgi:hypothetical protein
LEERKKEIEYWVSERATMREMIDQLEAQAVNRQDATVLPHHSDNDIVQLQLSKKKAQRKLKEKEAELKASTALVEDLKDQVHQQKQQIS